jgi:pyridoxine/pyridoxamine 5'-phosphate oxidase
LIKPNNNIRPSYWGGYSFTPYEIEFWEGNEFRLNKRNLYKKDMNKWNHYILEP